MWYVLFEILSAKVEFLPQFNVTKYGKTGIEYIQQMTYACSWIINAEIHCCYAQLSVVVMHLGLMRSNLAYASQVCNPQTITLCAELERIQRRATKFIMVLPFDTEISYKTRPTTLKMLPLCYCSMNISIFYFYARGLLATDADTLPKQVDKVNLVMNLRTTDNSTTYNSRHT